MEAHIEFRQSPDFAEAAEALGINTDRIFAMRPGDTNVLVLYTPNYDDGDSTIWSVWLKRDAHGVLVHDSVAVPLEGLWERIEEGLEEEFDE